MFKLYSIQSKLFMVFLIAMLIIISGGVLSLYFLRQELSTIKLFVATTLPRIESSTTLKITALQIDKTIYSITRTTQPQTLKSDFIELADLIDHLAFLTTKISQEEDETDILSLNLTSQSIRNQAQLVFQLRTQQILLLQKKQFMLQKARMDIINIPFLIMTGHFRPMQLKQRYEQLQTQILTLNSLLNQLEMAKTLQEVDSLESAYKYDLAIIFEQSLHEDSPPLDLPSKSFPGKNLSDLRQLCKLQRQNINIADNIKDFISELDTQVSQLNSLATQNITLVFSHFDKSAEQVIQRGNQTIHLMFFLMFFSIVVLYILYKKIVIHGFGRRLSLISRAMASDPGSAADRDLPMVGKDEISDMARALNVLLDKSFKLNQLATIDDLTKIYNRRRFFELGALETNRSIRKKSETAFLMLDLDHFKSINDTYGHGFGDTVLYETAQTCRSVIRTIDIFARYGGEEFVMFLPETILTEGLVVAERIRQAIESKHFTTNAGLRVKITMSLGLAMVDLSETTVDQALILADNALYKAKKQGRNKVAT